MGDYLKNGNKIGTCGRGYYATKSQLEKVKDDPEAAYYLNPKNGCSFAFPYPEYDGKEAGQISNFHEGEKAEPIILFLKREGSQTHHTRIAHHIHPKGGQGINLFCDCPYHSAENVPNNFNDEFVRFYLNEQVYVNSELAISAQCIYCGQTNIFEAEEAKEAAENLYSEANKAELDAVKPVYSHMAEQLKKEAARGREVARRILDTYLKEVEPTI